MLKKGDVVRLKSDEGLNLMTVESVDLYEGVTWVWCIWLDKDKHLQRQEFDQEVLYAL